VVEAEQPPWVEVDVERPSRLVVETEQPSWVEVKILVDFGVEKPSQVMIEA
jgi:hypothetical protein